MDIYKVSGDKRQYMDLLLLADESPRMIESYIDRGELYVLSDLGRAIGECLVTDEGGVLEIKSIAVAPAYQKHGCGRMLIEHVEREYAGKYSVLQAGTGESPLTVPFYERCGFVRSHVVKGFFTENYDKPIFEAGVQLVDMVYFRKDI